MTLPPIRQVVAPRGWRAWLTAEAPSSRLHARLVRLYGTARIFARNPLALVGVGIVVLLVAMALAAPWLAHGDPSAQDLTKRLRPPSAAFWFGTDELGRDIYTRVLYGARITLGIVALVVVIVAPIGLLVGCVAGYLGGFVDTVLMRVTDIFLAFPRLILALAFVAALGPGIENAVIAISLTTWPPYARIARAETLLLRESDFINAARLLGAGWLRIVFPHVMPLCLRLRDRARHPRHGRHYPDRRRSGLPRPRRSAPVARMGRHDLLRTQVRARSVVGGGLSGPGDLHGEPRLQPVGRRTARRSGSEAAMTAPLLDVADLRVSFRTQRGMLEAVRGVSFAMGREKLGIVGESGSGKTLTGRSILRLLPPGAELRAERLAFDGLDLLAMPPARLRGLRGRRIAMVMQDPKFSLNPVMPVGDQIAEAYLAHSKASRARGARRRRLRHARRPCASEIPAASMRFIPTRSPAAWASAS